MKKFLLSILALAGIAGTAFAGSGNSADDPLTVSQFLENYKNDNTKVFVRGFIVGSVDGVSLQSGAHFSLESASNTNLLLAQSSTETEVAKCIPVQLPAGDLRNALSLQQNPNNLGHAVILEGEMVNYFSAPGLKNTKSYQWVGEAPEPGGGSTGGGSTGGTTDSGYLTSGMDDFTIENVSLTGDLSYVWSWDNTYGAKASAFLDNTNYAAEAYLISPAITLTADQKSATISQALNFLNGNNRADFVNIEVREGTGAWTAVNVSAWPEGTSWGFVDDCEIDLSAYAGKTIQIGFHYKSTTSCAPTWEVKRLVIGATGSTTPSAPQEYTVAEAIALLNAGNVNGTIRVKGFITEIKEIDTGSYGNATYFIGDQATSTTTLQVYRGYYLNGAKFTSDDQIKVGDLVVVEGELEMYNNNTPEMKQGNKIISINGQTSGGNTGGNENPGGNTGSVEFKGECVAFIAEGYSYTGSATQVVTISGTQDAGSTMMDHPWTATGVCELQFTNNNNNVSQVTGGVVRWYKNDEITITPLDGKFITGLHMVSNSANPVCPSNVCTLTEVDGKAWTAISTTEAGWTGETNEAFTFGNGAQVRWQYLEVYYSNESGVDAIGADEGEAIYFDLQGRRVANPDRGLFIKVAAGKASKVVL